jgi:CheY-like chemotaxis protein
LTYKYAKLTPGPELRRSGRSGLRRKVSLPATASRILVVDRSGELLGLLDADPGASGFEILSAGDGREALEVACAELPDVVVADFDMPGMNGIELCRAVRSSVWVRLPIVLVIDSQNREIIATATEAGADFCLPKPVDPARLLQESARLIGERAAAAAGAPHVGSITR